MLKNHSLEFYRINHSMIWIKTIDELGGPSDKKTKPGPPWHSLYDRQNIPLWLKRWPKFCNHMPTFYDDSF